MAVERNQRVMEMVEEAIRENPDVSNDELQDRASEIDPRIGELSPRSFNARYPLQVKRMLKKEEEEKRPAGKAEGDGLEATVRAELLQFAKDVAGAQDRAGVIDVLTKVDEYVDRVMEEA